MDFKSIAKSNVVGLVFVGWSIYGVKWIRVWSLSQVLVGSVASSAILWLWMAVDSIICIFKKNHSTIYLVLI
jgi:hypothetical protein